MHHCKMLSSPFHHITGVSTVKKNGITEKGMQELGETKKPT